MHILFNKYNLDLDFVCKIEEFNIQRRRVLLMLRHRNDNFETNFHVKKFINYMQVTDVPSYVLLIWWLSYQEVKQSHNTEEWHTHWNLDQNKE